MPGSHTGAEEEGEVGPPPTAAQRRLWYHYGVDAVTDKYILDLSDSYERAIAVRMMEQAFLETDDNWKDEKFNGQPWQHAEGDDPEQLWEVPWEGILEFTYQQTKLVPTEKFSISPEVCPIRA